VREKFISYGEKREQQKEEKLDSLSSTHTHTEHIYIGRNKGKTREKRHEDQDHMGMTQEYTYDSGMCA